MSRKQLLPVSFGFVLGLASSAGLALAGQMAPIEVAGQLSVHAQQQAYLLRTMIREVPNPGLRDRMDRVARDLDADLDLLVRTIDAEQARMRLQQPIRPVPVPVVVEPVVQAPVVLDDASLSRILGHVGSQSFADDKKALLFEAVQGQWLTTAQVVRILGQFSFDDDKVDVAARLHGQVVDPTEWYTVYSALTFSSSKDELRRRCGG